MIILREVVVYLNKYGNEPEGPPLGKVGNKTFLLIAEPIVEDELLRSRWASAREGLMLGGEWGDRSTRGAEQFIVERILRGGVGAKPVVQEATDELPIAPAVDAAIVAVEEALQVLKDLLS